MKLIYILFFASTLFACHASVRTDQKAPSEVAAAASMAICAPPPPSSSPEFDAPISVETSKIIKEATLECEVEDYKKFSGELPQFLIPFKAFITSENQTHDLYTIKNRYQIRVPSQQFDTLLRALETQAIHVNTRDVSSSDVQEEYIDIEARLKTKKIYEEKYFQLLNKAKKVSEMIEIQNELRNIREEIESMEGRKNYLNAQVALSTIHLAIYQKTGYQYVEKENGFFYRFKKSILSGWDTCLNIIFGAISIWPICLLFFIFVATIYRRYQKKKAK